MKLQTKPLSVLERTSQLLNSGLLKETPLWFNVVAANPPVSNLARKPNLEYKKAINEVKKEHGLTETKTERNFYKTREHLPKAKLTKPVKLAYVEDELRELFYKQHPWELADPKILVENPGNMTFKWNNLLQSGKRLDGESVVQRTLFLVKENAQKVKDGETDVKLSIKDAYNQARYEYYQAKMDLELENQIACEEASAYGANFKKSSIEFGFEQEQKYVKQWKQEAIELTQLREAKMSEGSFGEAAESV